MKFVVMAGGIGSKLWPLSRKKTPKQFLKFLGPKSLFQMNVEGLLEKYSPEDIFVSTSNELIHFVEEQTPQIPKENYIIEPPLFKGSGPASGYAMLKVGQIYPDEVIMFYVQPVCIRTPNSKYLEMIEGIEALVKKYGKYVTGGLVPKYLETGSDLIKIGEKVDSSNGLNAYEVTGFVDVVKDRMTMDQVKDAMKDSKFITHCNHSTWTYDGLMNAIKEIKPDWHEVLMEIKKVIGDDDEEAKIAEIYERFQEGRLEVLTKELYNSGRAIMVELPFDWFHITTWNDVYMYLKDQGKSTKNCETFEIDSKDNLVVGQDKKIVALAGVEDMAVIDTKDGLLIVPREKSGDVKKLHDLLDDVNWDIL